MLFEQCFADLPTVNARDLVASWRPSYGEWLGAQAAEGFDHTTTGRYLEEKDIALEEMKAGEYDPAHALQQDADALSPGALRQAFALKGWTSPAPDHAHAMKETDWKASPWYRKEIPFRPDMTETRARVMAENFDRRRYRDQLLARGGEAYNGVGDMALGFGAALLGSLPDPINALPVGGGMAAASRAGTLGRALLTGAKAGAVEGAVSTALTDAIVLPDLASRGEDEGFADLALDTLAGGVLGSVFGASGGLLARRAALRRGSPDAPPVRPAEAVPAQEPTPFDASPDGGLLSRAGEGPATQPGEIFHPGEPLRDFDSSPDNGFLETTGQGPVTHNDAAQAARADNDLLRQSWTAGDRRAVADAVALGMNDVADGRPADVSAVLRESRTLERARREALSPVVVRSEDLGVPEGAGLTEYIAAAKVYHDALKLESESGRPVIQPQLQRPVRFSRKGWRKNQSTGADADKWKLFPKLREIIETSTLKSTEEVNKPRRDGFVRFHWVENVVELDGSPRLVGVMLAEDTDGNLFYNINADVEGWRTKKGDPSNLPAQSMTGESGSPIQAEDAAPPVASTLAEEGAGVNLHVENMDGLSPDFSTAAEPTAPPLQTPDEARRAEAEALANQDEALRQDMDDLEARGAADAEDVAASRTDAESSEAIGRETLNCAWAVEE